MTVITTAHDCPLLVLPIHFALPQLQAAKREFCAYHCLVAAGARVIINIFLVLNLWEYVLTLLPAEISVQNLIRGCATGLSVDKIGLKVHSHIILRDGLSDFVLSKDIIPYGMETWISGLAVMYDYEFSCRMSILINLLMFRSPLSLVRRVN